MATFLPKIPNRLRQFRSPRGEPFLSYRTQRLKARGEDVTEYIWRSKPPERQKVPREVLSRCSEILPKASREDFSVLEIGPGTGKFVRETLAAFPTTATYGILEADPNWARYCARLVKTEAPRCATSVAINSSGDFSLFQSQKFDLVQAHAVLIQVRAELGLRMLAEMGNSLKSSGLMIFDVFCFSNLDDRDKFGRAPWATYYHPDWINAAISSSDLKVIERTQHPYGEGARVEYWFVAKDITPFAERFGT